ncbi:Transcription factor TFIIIB component B [Homalodisca vitripennis]|nr:Transcription factor TFIIIB component B [Homalodisca vitripennis]
MEKSRAELENSQVVQETGATRYNTYSKRKAKRHEWTARETVQFYKALHTVGSDFAIMTKLFPKRSRHELKLKFKREERINLNLVDKAMTAPADFDFTNLEEELREENDQIEKKKIAKKMAAEAAKRERALKKEEKEKSKNKQNKNNNKNNKNVIKGQDRFIYERELSSPNREDWPWRHLVVHQIKWSGLLERERAGRQLLTEVMIATTATTITSQTALCRSPGDVLFGEH